MATETVPAVKAATIKELRAACPGATEKFLLDQIESESTLATASAAWMTELSNRTKTLEDELKAAKEAKPGVIPPVNKGKAKAKPKEPDEDDDEVDEDLEDAIGSFDGLVTKEVKRQVAVGQKADRMKAVVQIANKHPELHQAYLVACNGSSRMVKRLVAEKYDMMPDADK